MARNGSGTYSLPAGNPVVTGTTISSTWANNTLSDLATAMTASVAADGQTPITANFNWGGFDITNVDLVSGVTLTASGTVTGANYAASGTGGRFTADFSNATIANRFIFKSATTNGNTGVAAMPNGTATDSSWTAFNDDDPDNAAYIQMVAGASDVRITSQVTGTGTLLAASFYMGGTLSAQIATTGNWTFSRPVTFSSTTQFNGAATFASTVALGASATATTPSAASDGTSVATTQFVKHNPAACRAWVRFDGSTGNIAGTPYNVTSVTRNAAGDYTINFTNAMTDANYAWSGSGARTATGIVCVNEHVSVTPTTTALRIVTNHVVGGGTIGAVDVMTTVSVFGN